MHDEEGYSTKGVYSVAADRDRSREEKARRCRWWRKNSERTDCFKKRSMFEESRDAESDSEVCRGKSRGAGFAVGRRSESSSSVAADRVCVGRDYDSKKKVQRDFETRG